MNLRRLAAFLIAAAWVCGSVPAPAADLRVVSFNAAMGLGMKLRSTASFERLFTAHPRLRGATVLALQELCLNRRAQLGRFLDIMNVAHGAHYHYSDYASTRLGEACDKGQAIVSALPIVRAGTLRLVRVGAARVAVWVDLAIDGPGFDRLRVYNLHLSNREHFNYAPLERRSQQADLVLESALGFLREYPGAPIVLAGDFNALGTLVEPSLREPVIQRFLEYFQASQPDFDATFVLPYQLDWVFSANLKVVQSSAIDAWYSDHLPLVADFDY